MGLKLAVLCYLKKNGKTLMLYRNRKPNDIHEGKWNGLGGKLEKGESPEEGLIREVQEEANIDLLDYHLHGFITFPNFTKDDDWYVYLYTSNNFKPYKKNEKEKGKIKYKSEEGDLHWIKDSQLTELNLWEGDHLFLDWIKKNIFFSAKMVYREKKLISHQVKFYNHSESKSEKLG